MSTPLKPLPKSKYVDRFVTAFPNYALHLQRFCTVAELKSEGDLLSLKRGQAFEAIDAMREQGYSNGTVHVTMTAARAFYEWMDEREYLSPNPLAKVKVKGKRKSPMWNVLMAGEIDPFTAEAKRSGPRDWAVVCALLNRAFRASELCSLRWGEYREEGGKHVMDFTGKGAKAARLVLPEQVVQAAQAWLKVLGIKRPSPELPFIPLDRTRAPLNRLAVYEIVTGISKRAGIVREVDGQKKLITPHGLRATALSKIIKAQGIEAARQLARHEDIGTTVRYSRWNVIDVEEGTEE